MSDPAQPPAAVAVMPKPSCIRPRRADAQTGARPSAVTGRPDETRRISARERLLEVLAGVRLSSRDSQFLSRLVHWDKRNAAAVASLIGRAREAGREEAALTPRQREIIISALGDAALHRFSGAAGASCWDCELVPGGRCAEHSRDTDRARAYADLAALLATPAARTELELPGCDEISGFRQPVAS